MTIEHRYGDDRVPVDPERIVSLDVQWTDVLAALDAPPVGYIRDPNTEDGSSRGAATISTTPPP